MSLAVAYSRAQVGFQARLVAVEVHIANGLPSLAIVGLPETAVKESRERVRSALLHSGFEFPARRVTVNLAPADLPKQGGRYDLAIALGVLAASRQLPEHGLREHEFVAELALGGGLRAVRGVLPSAIASNADKRRLVCATDNGAEAALASPDAAFVANHLLEVCEHLRGIATLAPAVPHPRPDQPHGPDLSEVRGQYQGRRALEIAAAGAHSLLLIGPPGTGKTLLASRLPGVLPPLDRQQALESAALASISSAGFDPQRWRQRPVRAPHHSASAAALVGGGADPHPGEISLAHHGVLFLDELPEFRRDALEVLREPLESGSVTLSRAARQAQYPARFQLVAAMNPCPCGYLGDPQRGCRCTPEQIQRYRGRISGPLLDRIDLQIEMPRIAWQELLGEAAEDSATVRARVLAARQRQHARGCLNAELPLAELQRACALQAAGQNLLERASAHFRLSPRAVHRILRVARSIADLADASKIETAHLQEAIASRCLDRVSSRSH